PPEHLRRGARRSPGKSRMTSRLDSPAIEQSLGVVVPATRDSELLRRAVSSTMRYLRRVDLVVVFDSQPAVPPGFSRAFPSVQTACIPAEAPRHGFGVACNVGAAHLLRGGTPPTILVFLNDDAELWGEWGVGRVCERFSDPVVGVCSFVVDD